MLMGISVWKTKRKCENEWRSRTENKSKYNSQFCFCFCGCFVCFSVFPIHFIEKNKTNLICLMFLSSDSLHYLDRISFRGNLLFANSFRLIILFALADWVGCVHASVLIPFPFRITVDYFPVSIFNAMFGCEFGDRSTCLQRLKHAHEPLDYIRCGWLFDLGYRKGVRL